MPPHIVILFAQEDFPLARRLWEHLRSLGISAGMFDATVGTEAATHLLVISSKAAAQSVEITEAIETFLSAAPRENIYTVQVSDEGPTLPQLLRTRRDREGFLIPAPLPENLGMLTRCGRDLTVIGEALFEHLYAEPPASDPLRSNASGVFATWRTAAAGLGALALGLGIWGGTMMADARMARDEAQQATRFTSTLLTRLTEQLPANARRDVLISIAQDVTNALGENGLAGLGSDEIARRAQLLHFIGEARDVHGERDGAREAFALAYEMTAALLSREPDNLQRLFEHSQSAFWLGNSAYRAGDLNAAAESFESYRDLTRQLAQREPDNQLYRAEQAHAATNMGVIKLETGDFDQAAALFTDAVELFSDGPVQSGHAAQSDIANALGWKADAVAAQGNLAAAAEARQREAAIYARLITDRPQDRNTLWSLAHARREEGALYALAGRLDRAIEPAESGLETAAALFTEAPENVRFRRLYVTLLRDRARLALWDNNLIRAQLLLDEARRVKSQADEHSSDNERHLERIQYHLLAAEIASAAGAADTAAIEATQAILAGELALSEGYESARILTARAYFTHGESLLAQELREDAQRSFETARARFPDNTAVTDMGASDLSARIAWRLGEREHASTVRASLASQGYQPPDFQTFWQNADAAVAIDQSNEEGLSNERG